MTGRFGQGNESTSSMSDGKLFVLTRNIYENLKHDSVPWC
jgi:hypothetical protein